VRRDLVLLSILVLGHYGVLAGQSTSTTRPAIAVVSKNSQAISIIQTALAGTGALSTSFQDAVATGVVRVYFNGQSSDMPIVFKCKGTRMIRTELQKPKGTSVRIVNAGTGVIQQPDGTARQLLMNNTLAERVNFLPSFSMLSEYQQASMSVEYSGTAQVNGQAAQVVALRPLTTPGVTQADLDRSLTKTQFFIDPTSGTVLKIAYTNFSETNPDSGQAVEIYFSDFRVVNGQMVPFR
jgi:hypothetical protein